MAVLTVLASHSLTTNPLGGWGVRLFFVQSGFLITYILLRASQRDPKDQRLIDSDRAAARYLAARDDEARAVVEGRAP